VAWRLTTSALSGGSSRRPAWLARLLAGRCETRIRVAQINSVGVQPPTGPMTGIPPGWIRFTIAGGPDPARERFGNRGYNDRNARTP
jgi:hypothetical protein